MDSGDAIQLIVLLLLILLSAFFSSAETAMTTVNKIRIMSLADDGNKKAKTLLKIIENPGKLLSTILIGNNIVNLSASSLATTWTTRVLGNAFIGFITGVLTLLILLFGEITPKTLATLQAEKISLAYAPVIYPLTRLLTPVIFLVNLLSRGVLFLLHVDPDAKPNAMTEQELRTIVDVSHEDGVIESEERQMIYNVFDFGDSQAKDVMVPRIDMSLINVDATYEEVIQASLREPGRHFFIIVPDQFTMQTQKEFVMRHPRHGIMNIDVLSFERLAYRILEETGGADKIVLDDEGKNFVLRKVAAGKVESLRVLGANVRKPGYISEVKSVISELAQYDVKANEMTPMLEAAPEHSYLYYKCEILAF